MSVNHHLWFFLRGRATCKKCKSVIAEPKELIEIVNGIQQPRNRKVKKIPTLKEGMGRKCPYCGLVFYDMERYGEHKRDCPKKPK